jgi:hypothetical protein
MKSIPPNGRVRRRIDLRLCLWLLAVLAVTPAGQGAPPIEPLPPPDYSFDLASWTVLEGYVDARDILVLDFPHPERLLFGETLGLVSTLDDVDALSAANASVASDETFVLLFSVDAQTVGAVPPDSALIALHVPYNVMHQAARGQAPGDQFMSTQLFTQLGGAGGTIINNVLVRNNYDEGGTDFAAQPATSAFERALDDSLDVVDATAWLTRSDGAAVNVYFSATSNSPSLDTLPYWGYPSGADIYFNPDPLVYQPTELYAAHEQLQLDQDDDIDGLIVFDANENGHFDEPDQVLFSLAPGSPSLATIPGASGEDAAADVFSVVHDQMPTVFATAADLGLGVPEDGIQDNIDALELLLCEDALDCAARHGIRLATVPVTGRVGARRCLRVP